MRGQSRSAVSAYDGELILAMTECDRELGCRAEKKANFRPGLVRSHSLPRMMTLQTDIQQKEISFQAGSGHLQPP